LLAIKLAEMVEANLVDMPGYDKEVTFHPVKKWRFDYAWLDLKVALEVHGGVFANGRHTRGKGFTEDKVKMNNAQLLGWIVIEVTKAQVINGQMLIWIKDAILLRGKHAPDQAISKNDT
jgi:hypothetical protein